MIYTHDEAEAIVELFEELLDRYDITVPSDEDEERGKDNTARLYGTTYWDLVDAVDARLIDICKRAATEKVTEGLYVVNSGKSWSPSKEFAETTKLDVLNALKKYWATEFPEIDNDIDINDDLSAIGIAYTTSEDGEHHIQVYLNLEKMRFVFEIDGEETAIIDCAGYSTVVYYLLAWSFEDFIEYAEDKLRDAGDEIV